MTLAIQRTDGRWWTGGRWGREEARAEYERAADLPRSLPAENFDSDRIVLFGSSWRTPIDMGYDREEDNTIAARVRVIETPEKGGAE